jgi:FkbM family methyltransferase
MPLGNRENATGQVEAIFIMKGFRKVRHYGLKRSLYYLYWNMRLLLNRFLRGSYSQLGEDLIVDKLLGNKDMGFYVDIGAGEPLKCSNTKRFSRRGWVGLNIEPDPDAFGRLATDRPRDTNLNLGIAGTNATMQLYRFDSSYQSTFSREEADWCVANGYKLVDIVPVEVRKLDGVLEEYCKDTEIDFLSVDTEGFDLEVLRHNDWSKFRPKIICVETGEMHRHTSSTKYNPQIKSYLESRGYREAYSNILNSIFIIGKGSEQSADE